MSPTYTCPSCRGGFPELDNGVRCPWCGEVMNGEYKQGPFVSTFESDGGSETKSLLSRLRGDA